MKLMLNERLVSDPGNKILVITNRRVRHVLNGDGTSILLENIQSLSFQFKSYPVVFFLGILSLLGSMAGINGEQSILLGGITLGVLLIIAYYMTRSHYLVIASAGNNINVLVNGKNNAKIIDMVDLIEETICQRKVEMRSAP